MSSDGSTVLGVVLLARHGDREGLYQDPNTYTASNTTITPLGEVQEFQLGSFIRSLYFDSSSSSFIKGIADSSQLFDSSQVHVRADAGGEGGVIYDSAIALTQGLWQPTTQSTIKLSNGTNVTSPLNGYQYVPIESVEPNEDVSLEGFTSCPALDWHTTEFYNSFEFLNRAQEAESFLTNLVPYVDGRQVTLQNMWNIFDFMNVQSIHNATFNATLPPTYLAQARDLASFHEYGILSSPSLGGIGNIAFRTMIPSVLDAMQSIVNASDPLKFHYSAISYKPFLSLFNMTGVTTDAQGTLPPAIVNYAAAVAFEIRQPSSSSEEPFVRFMFKNGTDDDTFRPITMTAFSDIGAATDVPLSQFTSFFESSAVDSTQQWCEVCSQSTARGCNVFSTSNVIWDVADPVSPLAAGFIGAGAAIALWALGFGVLAFMGYLKFVRPSRARRARQQASVETGSSTHSITKENV